ncbi:UDP-2,4-diacetamido-2,4,6-trideoxy-beta-L-altropyranose hydrolase [Pontibacter diazotrophicus]|uniref:UDP-2,4-diacetamido-2,4, 6-trideoxy-beta-L-altropyranose hydrolase n=1 Tax=Pontibacter diazotrophicus TaxID=1400979 RepID=A0A3D8LGG0_9BACT|nr:UDP-2,4-diacetamido-2,4,6-trideoxy-beta-L-altropyranose hydrolase [Pontibacter diazotrophicus]RDV16477.1 UDP-2,4-diacetamido-2,4,6-trideoxy-beta-L-altropyranose hydrolase [Pontibacter diazotrophicus]
MNNKRRIIFRADGNSHIGLGHVVRSLALAAMLREEFECVFAIQAPTYELQEQIRKVCHGIIHLPLCAPTEERFIHELDAYISAEEMVVLDSYDFNATYQESIKSKGCPLVCIDDIQAFHFLADAIVNPAGGVKPHLYSRSSYTKLLLGPKYALLRSPFLKASKTERMLPEGKPAILLNLGGADPGNKTLHLAKELVQSRGIERLNIVVGAAYRHLVELQSWLQDKEQVILHHNLSAAKLQDLMQQCAFAVTSASGVAYEYAAVGGILSVLQTADNQDALYHFLIESGVAHEYQDLPQLLSNNSLKKHFQEQVATQRQHFDGHSDVRLKQLFRKLSLGASLNLRAATEQDMMQLFNWASDPEVRKNSFNQNPITLENHTRWFHTVMEDEQTVLYIAEANGKPVAHIRFNISAGKAMISYLIDADFRGQGLGLHLLQKGMQALAAQRKDVEQIEGLVQRENIASVRSFEKAGFSYGQPDRQYPEAHRFILPLK